MHIFVKIERFTSAPADAALEPLWSRFGAALESLWSRFGAALEPLWSRFGVALESLFSRRFHWFFTVGLHQASIRL